MQRFEHRGATPRVHPTAFVAPTAVLCGDVTIGPESRVLWGAVVAAESGPVRIGRSSIVMENAVLRGVSKHPLTIGDHVLVGPHAHLSGCTVEDGVFIATGSAVFNGAVLGRDSVVRVYGVVQVNARLVAGGDVPIGWIALGNPAEIFPPEASESILERLRAEGFSATVFDLPASRTMEELTTRYARGLSAYEETTPADGR